jgi:hypothetical protein
MQVFSQIKQNPYKKALILWVFDGDLEKLARIQQIEVVAFAPIRPDHRR